MTHRIAHITDVHWMAHPTLSQMPFKRLLGSLNLYLRGRHTHFSPRVQASLMQHLLDLKPDALVVSGDLTAQALASEFQMAKEALGPVMSVTPTFLIPGNHDVYTQGAKKSGRMAQFFGANMYQRGALQLWDHPNWLIIGLDASRPHPILASGCVPDDQLDALSALLSKDPAPERPILLVLHYPILDRRGAIYAGRAHGLLNANELISVLKKAHRKPTAILHGHEHHGFTVSLDLGEQSTPIFDCGSSGYAYMPAKRRAAAMNVYHFTGPSLVKTDRYLFDGASFQPEPGGAYATGR
jgi:3',5'-cyclic AMP phosphodiesterase CpdA